MDFLKIDAQGAKLSVFQNGDKRLKDAVVVQTEVSFVPLYKNQPTFGEIDIELRHQGFVPHCFVALNKRRVMPLVGATPYDAINQLLEVDVVYIRGFTKPDRMTSEQLKHLALHLILKTDISRNVKAWTEVAVRHHAVLLGSAMGL